MVECFGSSLEEEIEVTELPFLLGFKKDGKGIHSEKS